MKNKLLEINQTIDKDSIKSHVDQRPLIIVSNRAPVNFITKKSGEVVIQRSGGGLVTALLGLAQNIEATWIAAAINDIERDWGQRKVDLETKHQRIDLKLLPIDEETYEKYYSVISNQLLWFFQHSMWDLISSPNITRATWEAWDEGYTKVNQLFADAIIESVKNFSENSIVILQDYHLYLVPYMIRQILKRQRLKNRISLAHFIHIPWPGAEEMRILPPRIRNEILRSMTSLDLLGFQTKTDRVNFYQSVETFLPEASINRRLNHIWRNYHKTKVQNFPISIDNKHLLEIANSEETKKYDKEIKEIKGSSQLILRVDRSDPIKNIVRGFQAYGDMLEKYPEHIENVIFLVILVPSRLGIEEYHSYHDEIMASAGWVNSQYGTRDWDPVYILHGDNYPRAIAALKQYDVLLVNSIADGMNLVAKEGVMVNESDGTLILSERVGAREQLESASLVISPCDIYATSEALHQALTIPPLERKKNAIHLRSIVETNDINKWFSDLITAIKNLGLTI